MKHKLFGLGALLAAAMFFAACGGGSSGGGSTSEDGAGTATVQSLSSLPTVDLSEYDSSTTASADLAAFAGNSFSLAKVFGDNMRDVGGFSRAGCEANMHKQEVFRMSQTCQLDRCYPEAMETAGFITIPSDGSYAYYSVTPPEMSVEETAGMCGQIPAEREDERAACEARNEGAKNMKMKIGRFDNELRIDLCEGDTKTNEGTYGASGSVYTANVVRIGNWGGNDESSKFDMSVDLGTGGAVANGIVTLGTDGLVSAAGQMSGGFGSGRIWFERLGDSSNKVKGAFAGGFTDPFSDTLTEFTGKVYSHFGGASATGCAKFEFSGTQPAIPCMSMLPVSIPAAQRASFLASLGAELGISLDDTICQTALFCPNPNFDPANPRSTVKPMILKTSGQNCPEVTNTGVECFAISNASLTTEFGTEVTQTFTTIANASSPYYDDVNAFAVSDLTAVIGTIAFARDWDCTGAFTELNFDNFTPEQMTAAADAMQACQILEEKARGNDGMGGYNCGQNEQMNVVNNFAEGGGGNDAFGPLGGEFNKAENGSAPAGANACATDYFNNTVPQDLFVNLVSAADYKYCINTSDGNCVEYTMAPNAGPPPHYRGTPTGEVMVPGGQPGVMVNIIQLIYLDRDTPQDGVTVIFVPTPGAPPCLVRYVRDKHSFEGAEQAGEGRGCSAATLPPACQTAGITTCEQCGAYCMQPGHNCME